MRHCHFLKSTCDSGDPHQGPLDTVVTRQLKVALSIYSLWVIYTMEKQYYSLRYTQIHKLW